MRKYSFVALIAVVAILLLSTTAGATLTPVSPGPEVPAGDSPDGECHRVRCRHTVMGSHSSAFQWRVTGTQGETVFFQTEPGNEVILICTWQHIYVTNFGTGTGVALTEFLPAP